MSKPRNQEYTLRQAMRAARIRTYCRVADAAALLRVSEQDLNLYEQGQQPIPQVVLEMLLTMGYTMLRSRRVLFEYKKLRRKMRNENMLLYDD